MTRKLYLPVARVTNGQRAAICGLLLARVPFSIACQIVGVRPNWLDPYIGEDWSRERLSPPTRWTHDRLAELRSYWDDPAMKTATIASLFNITTSQVNNIVRREGWPLRRRGPMPDPRSIGQQPRPVRRWYRKLRDEYGIEKAREIAGVGR